MSRYLGPKHKLCRREGVKLCDSPKCPVVRRPYPPGVHGPKGQGRLTPYGVQFREKQKAKRTYGVNERQFHNYFLRSIRRTGDTGAFLARMLEMRLDNVVYRLGFAATRPQARQMVSHGFITVNGERVNIPSYQTHARDAISIAANKRDAKLLAGLDRKLAKRELPEWLALDAPTLTGTVVSEPAPDSLASLINAKAIVEHYSR